MEQEPSIGVLETRRDAKLKQLAAVGPYCRGRWP